MRVLIIGSGGREHTIAWSLRRSRRVREVFCAPGNGGIERHAHCIAVSPLDPAAVSQLVLKERVDLVVIGPEAPLAAGLVDHLQSQGIATLGPARDAARLESSKVFAKKFMQRHGIPTAACTIHDNPEEALKRTQSPEVRYPLVVKADGLAAGKGVVIARSRAEAEQAIRRIMVEREFGSSGDTVILEDFLEGVEASYIVFTDGETIVPAVAARDHKAVYDNDEGPNTGGMGAYSCDGILDPMLEKKVVDEVVGPVVRGMQEEGSGRPAGSRVQCPDGRSGGPGHSAPPRERLCLPLRSCLPAPPERIQGFLVGERRGVRGAGIRRVPGELPEGQGHFRSENGGGRPARYDLPLGHAQAGRRPADRRRPRSRGDGNRLRPVRGGHCRLRSRQQDSLRRDALPP
jgi:hypothetical protein